MNEVIYINKGYLKDNDENLYIRIDFPDDDLAEIWNSYNWEKAREELFHLQCKLTKLAYKRNIPEIRKLQDKITNSTEARMLAVKRVSEETQTMAGIDRSEMAFKF